MMRDHRRQLRKVESRQKKEKQKSERILQTFQSAVEAVTPPSSMVMSPGAAKEDSGPLRPFSATPLSSWHHIVMSSSSRYSATNLSSEHVHLPPLGRRSTPRRPSSSPATRSHSQPNLLEDCARSALSKSISALGIRSDPEMGSRKLSPAVDHLTVSRPALNPQQPPAKTKNVKRKKKKKKDNKHVRKGSNNPT